MTNKQRRMRHPLAAWVEFRRTPKQREELHAAWESIADVVGVDRPEFLGFMHEAWCWVDVSRDPAATFLALLHDLNRRRSAPEGREEAQRQRMLAAFVEIGEQLGMGEESRRAADASALEDMHRGSHEVVQNIGVAGLRHGLEELVEDGFFLVAWAAATGCLPDWWAAHGGGRANSLGVLRRRVVDLGAVDTWVLELSGSAALDRGAWLDANRAALAALRDLWASTFS